MSRHARKPPAARVSTGLVALGSAAVFAVYSAGYLKTKAAATRFADPRAARPQSLPAPGGDSGATAPADSTNPTAAVDRSRATGVTAAESPAVVTLAVPTVPVSRPGAPEVLASVPGATAAHAGDIDAGPAPAAGVSAAADTTLVGTAAAPVVATAVPAPRTPVPAAKYKDGTYSGWGSCRHGDLQATVVVAEGRITSAVISQCLTRYSCSWISPLPPQVTQRQSPEVDYVSGATDSAIAFYNALVDALSKAK